MADPPAPTGTTRARRRMHQCPHCDEIFVDEESFEKHKLTHQTADAPPAAEAPAAAAAPEPRPSRASRAAAREAPAAAAAAAPPPGGAESAVRPASAVRQEAGIAAPQEVLGDTLGDLPYDEGADVAGLGPMEWENAPPRANPFLTIYKFIEDFSEWLFVGLQKGFGVFGLSLVPAIGIAIRATVILALGLVIVGSGMLVGRKYGPWIMGQKGDDTPLLPPQRVIPVVTDDTKLASQAVLDFYAAIDGKSYSVAYDALSPAWKKELSFGLFENGYRNTQAIRCTVKDSKILSDGKAELNVDIEVVERGATKKFTGTYVVFRTESGWKLDSGSIK